MKDNLLLLLFTTMLASGQMLFKKVGLLMTGKPLNQGLIAIASSPWLYLSLALYGIATLLWIWLLSRLPLSQAYPWVGVGIILVPAAAWILHGEKLTPSYWVGVFLVATGVVLTQFGSRH